MSERFRDYSRKGYVYYKLCECGKRITADSTYCKSCAKKGKKNPKYTGKRWIRRDGYAVIYHKGKKILEHRYVWGKHYGKIPKGYDIHHKNENKSDNRPKNLELIKKKLHPSLRHIKDKKGIIRECSDCKKKLELVKHFPPRKNKLGMIAGYRGRCKECWNKYQAKKMRKWRG